jgi:hypothetical protein
MREISPDSRARLAGRGRVRGRASFRSVAKMCECRSPRAGKGEGAAARGADVPPGGRSSSDVRFFVKPRQVSSTHVKFCQVASRVVKALLDTALSNIKGLRRAEGGRQGRIGRFAAFPGFRRARAGRGRDGRMHVGAQSSTLATAFAAR